MTHDQSLSSKLERKEDCAETPVRRAPTPADPDASPSVSEMAGIGEGER